MEAETIFLVYSICLWSYESSIFVWTYVYVCICIYVYVHTYNMQTYKHKPITSAEQRGAKPRSSFMDKMALLFLHLFWFLSFLFLHPFFSLCYYTLQLFLLHIVLRHMESRRHSHDPLLLPTPRKAAHSSSPIRLLRAHLKCSRTGISVENREQSIQRLQKGALACLLACPLVCFTPPTWFVLFSFTQIMLFVQLLCLEPQPFITQSLQFGREMKRYKIDIHRELSDVQLSELPQIKPSCKECSD